MKIYELIAPCHFGLEAVLKKEIIDLGYDVAKVEDGRVTFYGDDEAVARANIGLRTAERVMIKVGQFKAYTFDEFFENIKALEWENYIPVNGRFWVTKASSVKSKLFSVSDLQSLAKKAIVDRLKRIYGVTWFEEDGNPYPIRISFMKDEATVAIDTTGDSLHKRGYRQFTSKAPITETLAAALIMLTPWRSDRILVDPFCGCGTFPIEAAMIGANISPGMNRSFTATAWDNIISRRIWDDAYEEARDIVDLSVQMSIQGYDIDGDIVKAARENAKRAGVGDMIHFQQRDVCDLSHPKKYGFIITNPPYGERIEDKETVPEIYKAFGERFKDLDSWSAYVITSCEDTEKYFGRKADKNRKIYNGMMKTYFYQFMGAKPPKRKN